MGSRRADRWHGIEVSRQATSGPGDRRVDQVLMRRICVRYQDGRRMCFIPEAGEEFFSRDDVRRVVGMLHIGSEAMEWGMTSSQRYPGAGPYDTGAV